MKVPRGPRNPTRRVGESVGGGFGGALSFTTVQDRGMDEAALRHLLEDVRSGATRPDDALAALRHLPYADLGFARVDHHRHLRQGMAEAVYGPGKTPDQAAAHSLRRGRHDATQPSWNCSSVFAMRGSAGAGMNRHSAHGDGSGDVAQSGHP